MTVPFTLVLPCLNEVQALPWIAERLPAGATMLLADNGSDDGSQVVASELGAQVIDVPQRGYGAAVHAGVEAAQTELVAVIDTDASLDPGGLVPLVAAVDADRADLAMCVRQPVSAAAMPWHARAGNRFLAGRLSRRAGIDVHDLGPARVFRRDPYLGLNITDRAFGYPMEVLVQAARANWRITEFPMPYYERIGESKVTGSVRGSIRATRQLLAALP